MRFRLGSLLPPPPRHPLRHSPLRLPLDDQAIALRQQDRHLEHRHPHLWDPIRQHPLLDQASRRYQQDSIHFFTSRSIKRSSSLKRWISQNQPNRLYSDAFIRIHSRGIALGKPFSMISWRARRSLGWPFAEPRWNVDSVLLYKIFKYHPLRLCP